MFYLDTPDYMLDPPEEKPYREEDNEYETWVIRQERAGRDVPCTGETIYIPYDDDVDCWSEQWTGSLDQQEYLEQGLVFTDANKAVAKARQDMEVILGHVG